MPASITCPSLPRMNRRVAFASQWQCSGPEDGGGMYGPVLHLRRRHATL